MHPTGSIFIALGGLCVLAAAAFLGLRLWSSDAAVSEAEPQPLRISAEALGPGTAGQMVTVEGRLVEIDRRQPGLQYLIIHDGTGNAEVPYLDTSGDERVFTKGGLFRVTGLVVADESGATLVPRSSEGVVPLGDPTSSRTPASDDAQEGNESADDAVKTRFAETPPGMFSVAVASTALLQEAAEAARPYHEAGYEVGIAPISVGSDRRYRVLLGPYVDRTNAEVVLEMIRPTVADVWIVQH